MPHQFSGAEAAIAGGDEPHGADPEDTASHVERTMEQVGEPVPKVAVVFGPADSSSSLPASTPSIFFLGGGNCSRWWFFFFFLYGVGRGKKKLQLTTLPHA